MWQLLRCDMLQVHMPRSEAAGRVSSFKLPVTLSSACCCPAVKVPGQPVRVCAVKLPPCFPCTLVH